MLEIAVLLSLALDGITQFLQSSSPTDFPVRANLYGMSWRENLIVGVLIGSTIAGTLGYSMNYVFRISEPVNTVILSGYALIMTFGLYNEYGNLRLILVFTIIGTFLGGNVMLLLTKRVLPQIVENGEPGIEFEGGLDLDEPTNEQEPNPDVKIESDGGSESDETDQGVEIGSDQGTRSGENE
jgi:hypothetical protein